jgi:hypothetical protein
MTDISKLSTIPSVTPEMQIPVWDNKNRQPRRASLQQVTDMATAGAAASAAEAAASAAETAAAVPSVHVADYPALRAYSGAAQSALITGSGIAGTFVRDATVTVDNGGTQIVGVHGWRRVFDGEIDPRWFGATRSLSVGVAAANTSAIQAAIDAAFALGGGTVRIQGRFGISGNISIKKAVRLIGSIGRANWVQAANADGLWCVSGTGYDGVTLSGEAAAIVGITVANAPQDGIVVAAGVFSTTIAFCEVFHGLGNGITANGGVTQIEWTHVIGPAKHGIVLNSGDNKVFACEVQQPNSADGGGAEPLNTYDCIHIISGGSQQILNCRMGDDLFRSRDAIRLAYVGAGGGIQIIGNDFQNFTQAAIRFPSGNPVAFNIVGNKFVSGSANANKCALRNDVVVQDLVFTGNALNATGIGGLGGFYFNAALSRAVIRSNDMTGNWSTVSSGIVWVNAADRDTSSDNGSWIEGPSGALKAPAAVGRTLTGATPSVPSGASADLYWLNNAGATTVTDFLNGYTGQEITLFAVNSNTTVKHDNAKIRLRNNEDWAMPIYSVLRLKKAAATFTFGAIWYELERQVSGAVSGTTGLSVGGATTVFSGTGTPEGAVTAPVGCMFLRKDGGASTTMYVKESGTGNTGWVAK